MQLMYMTTHSIYIIWNAHIEGISAIKALLTRGHAHLTHDPIDMLFLGVIIFLDYLSFTGHA